MKKHEFVVKARVNESFNLNRVESGSSRNGGAVEQDVRVNKYKGLSLVNANAS